VPAEQPTLTDGTVTLRPWRDDDIEPAAAGHDDDIDYWFGNAESPTVEAQREIVRGWRERAASGDFASFVIEEATTGGPAGVVEVRRIADRGVELSWWLYAGRRGRGLATRAVRVVTDWALTGADQGGWGATRVQARVEPGNKASMRVATRAGLRQEGVQRVEPGSGDRPETSEYVVLARLAGDPPLSDPESFRSLLNSFLPRKRAISQMLLRDPEGRVLLCQLTYKRDWDLPGGVVEVGESPRLAVQREVEEELGLEVEPGALVLTDWLPPWGGWDDALCLVYDGGTHAPEVLAGVVMQEREIRDVRFCTLEEVDELAADFTARRVRAAVEGTLPYTESGR